MKKIVMKKILPFSRAPHAPNIGLFEDKVPFGDFPKVLKWSLAERRGARRTTYLFILHMKSACGGTSSEFSAEFFRL